MLHRDKRFDADNKWTFEERLWWKINWYILLWYNFRNHQSDSIDDYVVKIKWKIKWVYAWTYDNYAVKCNDWNKIWKYWIPMNSKNIFHNKEECINYYTDLFNELYKPYIKKRLEDNIKYINLNINKLNEDLEYNKTILSKYL